MSEWKEIQLRNICSDISYGYTASASNENVGPKFLRITDISRGRINWENVPYCKISDKDLKKYQLGTGDIVIARTGATTGYNAIIKNKVDAVYASYLIRFQIDINKADPFFVGHVLQSKSFQDYVDSIAGGSAQPGANAQQFADYEFLLPPLPQQKLISEVLTSLDDKIDILLRQNKTLETLAETLFRRWFIEDVERIKSSNLEDWILFDPRERLDKQKKYQMFEMKCLSNIDMSISDGVIRDVSSATTFINGDTLLAKITPCLENGKTGFVMHLQENEVARGSTEFIVLRTKGQASPYWVYCLARSKDFHDTAVLSMTGTSGRQRVQVNILRSYEVKVDIERMRKFHNSVDPYFQKIKSNQIQIRTLTQLRDTILPKLMSGEMLLNN